MTKVGFIGAGKMAEAIMSALLDSKTVAREDLVACDIAEERRVLLQESLGVTMHAEAAPVIDAADVVFLAVKPQVIAEALAPVVQRIASRHLVISIAAGKTIEFLEALLPAARVIRVMPNLPCVVNAGVSAFCLGERTTSNDRLLVSRFLECCGKVVEIPKSQFDIVTALSGSGPAFFAYVVDCMVDAADQLGMQREAALQFAEHTMFGTAKLLIEKSMDPKELIASVSSAKGTTVEGLNVLKPSDVHAVMVATLGAAARRSRELSS